MPIIDVKELFKRLCNNEYELLKYIYRTQGETVAPINHSEASTALSVDKSEIRTAVKRLVDSGALIAEGEGFKINSGIFKKIQTQPTEQVAVETLDDSEKPDKK